MDGGGRLCITILHLPVFRPFRFHHRCIILTGYLLMSRSSFKVKSLLAKTSKAGQCCKSRPGVWGIHPLFVKSPTPTFIMERRNFLQTMKAKSDKLAWLLNLGLNPPSFSNPVCNTSMQCYVQHMDAHILMGDFKIKVTS